MYCVVWEIDVKADSPVRAAKKAREIQRDPASTATLFYVGLRIHLNKNELEEIDLQDYEDMPTTNAEEDGVPAEKLTQFVTEIAREKTRKETGYDFNWTPIDGKNPEINDTCGLWSDDLIERARAMEASLEVNPSESNLNQEDRILVMNMLCDRANYYDNLLRNNEISTPIMHAVREEQARLRNLASKISR